jgi:uncharacterized membrane protein
MLPLSSRSVQATATERNIPKPTICRQRSERQPTLQLLFVAPSPGPVILINHVPVTDSASMRRKRYAVLQRPTPERVSGLSDAVFAVLITVLVFNLRPPELPTFGALLLLWPTWLSYAVSYLFIAIVWTNHHYLMRYATEANLRLLWFNFAHLFSMSLLPLSTAWMANSELAPQPVAFYAAVFFLVNATYICLIWELIDRIPVAQDHAPPINHDFVSFRGGFGCRAEISPSWARNLYLLPDRLSETRSAGSWETDISGIKRSVTRT